MRQLKLLSITILFLGAGSMGAKAQKASLPAGSSIISTNDSFSYSVGQLAHATLSGTGGSVNEGVQHAFNVEVIAGVIMMPLT